MSELDIPTQREEIDRLFRRLAVNRYEPSEEQARVMLEIAARAKAIAALLEKGASTLLAELKKKKK